MVLSFMAARLWPCVWAIANLGISLFFSRQTFDAAALHRSIPCLHGSRIDQFKVNTLTCTVERQGPVRVSFFGDLDMLGQLSPPDIVPPGVAVASLLDVAATKMRVVQSRAAAKDYLDVAALLETGQSRGDMLAGATTIYGKAFNPLVTVKALSYFGDGDLAHLPAQVQARLLEAVRRVK